MTLVKLAWEYDETVLITLCEMCHKKEEEELAKYSEKLIEVLKQFGATSKEFYELFYYVLSINSVECIIQILHEYVQTEYTRRNAHSEKLFGDSYDKLLEENGLEF